MTLLTPPPPPTFWRTVFILLRSARRRATGRQRRARQLLNQRTGKQSSTNWGIFGIIFGTLIMVLLNSLAAFAVHTAAKTPDYPIPPPPGKIAVSHLFIEEAETAVQGEEPTSVKSREAFYRAICKPEAKSIATRTGQDKAAIEQQLFASLQAYGTTHLVEDAAAGSKPPFFAPLQPGNRVASMLGSLVLFIWIIMLTFQGEGLELDLQRRRHPMWEWVFSHPVPQGAVFLAEMLSPIAASPMYWGAPAFAGLLYGFTYGPELGLAAVPLIGVPITVALACLGKACENAVVLRLAPRSRGAVTGIMGWLGYATMMFFFLGVYIAPQMVKASRTFLRPLAAVPWPWLRLFLGGSPGGTYTFLSGAIFCWTAAAAVIAFSVWFSVWATQQGLAGNFAATDAGPARSAKGNLRFGNRPLYRKEMLWFLRDRSAIVQTILIPITVAATQMFNFRFFIGHAQDAWNYLSGAAILFGTYFLWVLGPKSLASEGQALWIALTWPTGLESLLKAKAWLWAVISSSLVALVLIYDVFLFPSAAWKIALVALSWWVFGRSMAEKSVTLVTVTSESGEVQKVPAGRRWAAQLGMFTFAIGVLSQQWHLAIMGIVFSWLTAAAMWQNFRARLPYLYDPWSEELPPPPTLMHAMISISALIEIGAVITGIVVATGGKNYVGIAMALGYAVASVVVTYFVARFLDNRGVRMQDIWLWAGKPSDAEASPAAILGLTTGNGLLALAAGIAAGLALGLFARGYMAALAHIPLTAGLIRKSQQEMASIPFLKTCYAVMAVAFAPFAEEYLFRGLLYRALDREWGGWTAILGSAAFFATYHSPISWLPVGLLGVANALIFKKTGRLAPAVLLHMAYNAVVSL